MFVKISLINRSTLQGKLCNVMYKRRAKVGREWLVLYARAASTPKGTPKLS